MSTNIADLLRQRALAQGGQTAIVHGRSSVTFAELDAAADRAARRLGAAGLQAGDRALLFCPISAQLYVTVVGMFRIGVVPVLVDPGAGPSHLAACCERVQPRAFVGTLSAHLLRLVSPSLRRLPVKVVISGSFETKRADLPAADDVAWAPVHVRPGAAAIRSDVETGRAAPAAGGPALALITFTSGSTGAPKVIARTHEFLLAQHRVLENELRLRAGEIDLVTLPIFVLANLASGVTSIIPDVSLRRPGYIDAAGLVRQIRTSRPTRSAASPALLEQLAAHLAGSEERLPMRRIATGGGPVFPVLIDRLARIAPTAEIEAVYGSSEAEPIAVLRHVDLRPADRCATRRGKGLLAGLPVAAIQVRIIADRWGTPLGPFDAGTFDAEALPPGACGEIVVSGPHVLNGYLDGRGDDETKIRAGEIVWHRTGDAGYMDAAGRLWLLGRCSGRVTDARGTLYPLAVEAAASEVPGVRRSAFAGSGGRRILVVERDPDVVSPQTARAILRRELAWALLDEVVVVKRIPVDGRHNAKIDYPALERLLRRLGGRAAVDNPSPHRVFPTPQRARPGVAPVCSPSASTRTPLTSTSRTPTAY